MKSRSSNATGNSGSSNFGRSKGSHDAAAALKDDDDEEGGGSGGVFVPLEDTVLGVTTVAAGPSTGGNDAAAALVPTSSSSPAGGLDVPPNVVDAAAVFLAKLDAKTVISSSIFTLLFFFVCDSLVSAPEHRLIPPNFSSKFLAWVQAHPASGLIWIVLFISAAVVCMIPIGTPLTLGCGYIYKGAYGWRIGVLLATGVSMLGSALGAVACFLLGRYLMRDTVRKWIRKYPLFDAIDVAAAEHGLRIMAMLYLTPILPLGPVSYMCGTTSLKLSHFVLAKIASLPLMMLYVFIGASAGTLIGTPDRTGGAGGGSEGLSDEQVKSIEENQTLIVSGILLSFVSIACITHYIKKELNTILDRQKRQQKEEGGGTDPEAVAAVEMGQTAPRQRKH